MSSIFPKTRPGYTIPKVPFARPCPRWSFNPRLTHPKISHTSEISDVCAAPPYHP